jgi:hypothetical protein
MLNRECTDDTIRDEPKNDPSTASSYLSTPPASSLKQDGKLLSGVENIQLLELKLSRNKPLAPDN